MKSALLDSNILIYYFNGLLVDDPEVHDWFSASFNISVITQIEFLGWHKFAEDSALLTLAERLISNATVFELNDAVAQETIRIRQQFKVKTPDAIIAATARVHDMKVITNNVSDFKNLGIETLTARLRS